MIFPVFVVIKLGSESLVCCFAKFGCEWVKRNDVVEVVFDEAA